MNKPHPESATDVAVVERPGQNSKTRHAPMYHVVLLDDDDHTYDYVVDMLGDVFGYGKEKAYQLAVEVDTQGRCVLATLPLEHAEVKRDQVVAYGADPRLPRSTCGMNCVVEPAP